MEIISNLMKNIFAGIFGLFFGIFSLIVVGVDYYVFFKAYGVIGLFSSIVLTPVTIIAAPFYALFVNHFWLPMILSVIHLILASISSNRSQYIR